MEVEAKKQSVGRGQGPVLLLESQPLKTRVGADFTVLQQVRDVNVNQTLKLGRI